jgi:hypothetical protein
MDSIKRVDNGTALVNHAGATIGELVRQSHHVAGDDRRDWRDDVSRNQVSDR